MEKMLGIMLDCSRNAVMKPETVKDYAKIIKKMGYNMIMLYTEDTYEVDNQPLFGHLRGKYTKEELKDLDEYCKNMGIELIPCIQTLAHLNAIFEWSEYEDIRDCVDILLSGEEKTYKLIDDMFSTLSQCFTTKKIHIGMDEAHRVGLGKYFDRHGAESRFDIINNHLHKVCEIAAKYGFEPMIWSDMFCCLAMDTNNYYDNNADMSKIAQKANLPENVSLIYWDYYKTEYEHYDKMIKINKAFDRNVYFAGGAWTWRGFVPDNKFSIETTEPAVKACMDNNIDGMFFTMWGDDGSECSKYSVLPSLVYAAEASRGNHDMNSIKAKFKEVTGCDFDSFMLLDKVNEIRGEHRHSPHKYLLYNDVFGGLNDYRTTEEDEIFYKNLKEEIKNAGGKGDYEYIFDTAQKLCEVLALKANIGNRTRQAYKAKDMEKIKALAGEYEIIAEKLNEFYDAFSRQWFKENKPFGFDVQDIRLGGLMQRIKSSGKRLLAFAAGEIDDIPELDEEVIKSERTNAWARYVSPNVISHII